MTRSLRPSFGPHLQGFALASLVIAFGLAGCDGGTSYEPPCVPGTVLPCTCPGGESGGQACLEDGSYSPCLCDTIADLYQPDIPRDSCVPNCTGLQCGGDGCGGSCGTCPGNQSCNANGQCGECVPNCSGVECGNDGCGGSCGECVGGFFCNGGFCTDEEPSCSDGVFNGEESDVDCGGPVCSKCGLGADCLSNRDCTTNVCSNGTDGFFL